MIDMFGILATPLAYIMRFIYNFLGNYGWTIIVFTVIVRILMIPLSLMQQKSTARMSAYQPMIQELQKKWAGDKNRQNQELQKFYSENNIKMTGGCAPMLVNMLVIFGIIAVIQAPLKYMIDMPQDQIDNARYIVADMREDIDFEDSRGNYTIQSVIIGEMKADPQLFIDGIENADGELVKVDSEYVQRVEDFNFEFLGMNLAEKPSRAFNRYLIMPILSILTMFASQFIIMKTSGQAAQGRNTMLIMTLVMGVMFGFFAFTVPVGFSLYYTVSNIVMTGQQMLMRLVYDPKKMQEEIAKEIEAKKQLKKAKKVVKVKDTKGYVIEKEMSDNEIARLRLEKARQLDEAKYLQEDEKTEMPKTDKKKTKTQKKGKPDIILDPADEDKTEETKPADSETVNTDSDAEDGLEPPEGKTGEGEQNQEEYRPGRRRRAKLKKEESEIKDEEKSFADIEMEAEQKQQEPKEDA